VKVLADNLEWTTALGNAFSMQQSEVMDAVQRMRKKAEANGALFSTQHQTVQTTQIDGKSVIVIEPADSETLSVPEYDSTAVYGVSAYPYPAIYSSPENYAAGAAIAFGAAVEMGAWAGGGWAWRCDWRNRTVTVNEQNDFISAVRAGRFGGARRVMSPPAGVNVGPPTPPKQATPPPPPPRRTGPPDPFGKLGGNTWPYASRQSACFA
jgi:hypothetical protein